MPSIADSVVEMVQWAFPEHAGAPGQIHGGRMMQWITEAGTLAAGRGARGPGVPGGADDIDLPPPAGGRPIALLKAPGEDRGESSVAVGGRRFESTRSVLPEDALFGNTMFVGKMLMALDEAGGILSMRYCKGQVMTACLDALDFYSPIFMHEVVTFRAGLNHVGTSSLEIGVKVLSEVPWSGEVRHACTAFLTFVHLGPDLRPRRCPPFTPETPGERRRWSEAVARRELRLERVERLKAALSDERGEGGVRAFPMVADQAQEGQSGRPAGQALLEDPPRDHRRHQERRRGSPSETAPPSPRRDGPERGPAPG